VSVGSQVLDKKSQIAVDVMPDSPAKDPWNTMIKIDLNKFEQENRDKVQRDAQRRLRMKADLED